MSEVDVEEGTTKGLKKENSLANAAIEIKKAAEQKKDLEISSGGEVIGESREKGKVRKSRLKLDTWG